MNLLNKPNKNKESDFNKGIILYKDFRQFQYDIIEDFIKTSIDYISKQNNNYLEVNKIIIDDVFTYSGIRQNELLLIDIIIDNKISNVTKSFVKFYMPKLIDGSYFILNENYYIPSIYVLDKPMVVKGNSITLHGLFNSMTLYLKKDVCIFMGINILLSYFLQLFLKDTKHESLYDNIVKTFKLPTAKHTDPDIINYFNGLFRTQNTTKNQIIAYIERLFFDNYTKSLYDKSYNLNNLRDIIIESITIILNSEAPSFINLKNKRMVFMELLLTPYLKKVANCAKQSSNNYNIDQIKMGLSDIIKHFTKTKNKTDKNAKNESGLDGNYIYNIGNLYNGILSHKCCFVNPGSTNPPSEISGIHSTHLKTICPITVGDMDPGHTISIVPDVTVDWFGNFCQLSD